MNSILCVGIGGFIGSILRYLLGVGVDSLSNTALKFPYATLIVNVVGSFFIGLFFQILANGSSDSQAFRLFIITGVLGGFTTFSAFSLETYVLIKQGAIGLAIANVAAQLIIAMLAVFAGVFVASK